MYIAQIRHARLDKLRMGLFCLPSLFLVEDDVACPRQGEVAVDLLSLDKFLDQEDLLRLKVGNLDGRLDAESLDVLGNSKVDVGLEVTAVPTRRARARLSSLENHDRRRWRGIALENVVR